MKFLRIATLALPLALLLPAAAHAQSLPPPAEFYFDDDARAVRTIEPVGGDAGDALVQKLLKEIERKPRDAHAERAQLARIAMAAGRRDLGDQLYGDALRMTGSTHSLWRALVWNYGWDLYRAGDARAALAQWQQLASGGYTAGWMPPTFAVALWSLDRRDEAVRWYAAAVRTEPTQWSGTERYAELLPDWREQDRATLAEVQQAWAADPPAWP